MRSKATGKRSWEVKGKKRTQGSYYENVKYIGGDVTKRGSITHSQSGKKKGRDVKGGGRRGKKNKEKVGEKYNKDFIGQTLYSTPRQVSLPRTFKISMRRFIVMTTLFNGQFVKRFFRRKGEEIGEKGDEMLVHQMKKGSEKQKQQRREEIS